MARPLTILTWSIGLLVMAGAITACGGAAGLSSGVPSSTSSTAGGTASSTAATAGANTGATAGSSTGVATPLIDHVQWTSTDKGRQLQVFPTAAARVDTVPTDDDRAWAEVLVAAPNANSPGMQNQFRCHWVFARLVDPNKPSWNLEPWRPDVGYAATVAARCNPGGPED